MKFKNPAYLNYVEKLVKSNKNVELKEVTILSQCRSMLFDGDILIDDQNKNGKTLLHIAAENGLGRVAQLCVEYSANIQLNDNQGKTPLDLATEKRHFAIQGLLKANMPKSNQSASASETETTASTNEIKPDDSREVVKKLDNLRVSPDKEGTKISRKNQNQSKFLPGLEKGFLNKEPKAKAKPKRPKQGR